MLTLQVSKYFVPAQRGWSRHVDVGCYGHGVVPVGRGWSAVPDPVGLLWVVVHAQRGWSRMQIHGRVGDRVVPAQAGLVRCSSKRGARAPSRLRTRGAGPGSQPARLTAKMSSLRRRGWSLEQGDVEPAVAVVSAKAGPVPP